MQPQPSRERLVMARFTPPSTPAFSTARLGAYVGVAAVLMYLLLK